MKNLAVLISNAGTGTNLQAIIDGVESGQINAEIAAVVSDTEEALGLNRAKKHHLPIEICPKKEDLLPLLSKLNLDYVCLAGWKQIILDEVIDAFSNRILNTHPGLIPDTMDGVVKNPDGTNAIWNKGKMTEKAIQNFLENHATYAGCTNHFLSREFDFGPVLGRVFEKIQPNDTVDSLYSRLKVKENQLYIDVLKKLTQKSKRKKSVLIIGYGGREHAIGWKLSQSLNVGKLYFAPGNGGTKELGENINIKVTEIDKLLNFSKENQIDLTVVGPEASLELGIANKFIEQGLRIFGPTKEAAQLETSKAWAIEFMKRHGLPHPISKTFTDYKSASEYIEQVKGDCVLKADGLTFGKGVFVCTRVNQAKEALQKLMVQKIFGKAGETVIIQQRLVGREASVMAFCDGKIAIPIIPAQDYKRAYEQDKGPNTGGIGSFAPAPLTPRLFKKIERLLTLTVEAMKEEGRIYVGVLYAGLMIVGNEPFILEYNCRMGDPETQVQLPLLTSDLFEIMDACIDGRLSPEMVKFSKDASVCVVLTSEGYPGKYQTGRSIQGLREIKKNGIMAFHAATTFKRGQVITDGGRVLGITAVGSSVESAKDKVYSVIGDPVKFENMFFRKDIASKTKEV